MTRSYFAFGMTILLAALFFSTERRNIGRQATAESPVSCPTAHPTTTSERGDPLARASDAAQSTLEAAFDGSSRFVTRLALFRLAARADSDTLQKLVFDAGRLPNDAQRRVALLVFLERLTEFDAPSALALARSLSDKHRQALLASVWQHWALIDLDSALQAARGMADVRERDLAARAMLAAYGYAGTIEAETISASLKVTLNDDGRSRLFERLVAESPTLAFDHVNTMEASEERDYAIRQLARILVTSDGREAAAYTPLLEYTHLQDLFLAEIVTAIGAHDPAAAMDAVANIGEENLRYHLHSRLIGRIVDRDPALATELAARITDVRMRDMAYYRIVEHHVDIDPLQAAVWAAYISDPVIRDYAERAIRWARKRHAR